ncbi:hypothetical protein JUM001_03030 [Clostridium perfringens]|nr:hypothetical protein JUM001_03030 [Clostridium perfringens]
MENTDTVKITSIKELFSKVTPKILSNKLAISPPNMPINICNKVISRGD